MPQRRQQHQCTHKDPIYTRGQEGLDRKTEFYAKSVHCKGNVVLKSANLTATADLIDLTDVSNHF